MTEEGCTDCMKENIVHCVILYTLHSEAFILGQIQSALIRGVVSFGGGVKFYIIIGGCWSKEVPGYHWYHSNIVLHNK